MVDNSVYQLKMTLELFVKIEQPMRLKIFPEIIYRFSQACLFVCWQLLICENTLIQVVKLKKKTKPKTKEKILALAESRTRVVGV